MPDGTLDLRHRLARCFDALTGDVVYGVRSYHPVTHRVERLSVDRRGRLELVPGTDMVAVVVVVEVRPLRVEWLEDES